MDLLAPHLAFGCTVDSNCRIDNSVIQDGFITNRTAGWICTPLGSESHPGSVHYTPTGIYLSGGYVHCTTENAMASSILFSQMIQSIVNNLFLVVFQVFWLHTELDVSHCSPVCYVRRYT